MCWTSIVTFIVCNLKHPTSNFQIDIETVHVERFLRSISSSPHQITKNLFSSYFSTTFLQYQNAFHNCCCAGVIHIIQTSIKVMKFDLLIKTITELGSNKFPCSSNRLKTYHSFEWVRCILIICININVNWLIHSSTSFWSIFKWLIQWTPPIYINSMYCNSLYKVRIEKLA